MSWEKLFTLATAAVLILSSSASAQSRRLIYEGAYDGAEQKVFLLNKKVVRQQQFQGAREILFKVDYEIQAKSFNPNSKWEIERYSGLVNCSVRRPFVASKYSLNSIAPWEDPFEVRMFTNRLVWEYWDICHNVRNAARFDLKQKARQYGYKSSYEVKQSGFPSSLQQYLK